MNRIFTRTLAVVIMSAAVFAAPQKPAAPADKGNTKTFIGCLEPGSNGGYMLLSAAEKGVKGSKDKLAFVVLPASPKLAMDVNVTKQVEITGTIDAGSAKPGTLPTLTATSVKFRAEYCGVPVPH